MSATTEWIPYSTNQQNGFMPQFGEWCLWTAIIDEERNYFSGRLRKTNDRICLDWDGYALFWIDEISDIYFARIIRIKE